MAGPIRQPIDIPSLERYIEQHVPQINPPIDVLQFGYGQSNPTYLLTSIPTNEKFVLRKKPPGALLSKTAHAVEREFRVLEALGRAGGKVPAPKVLVLCGDRRVLGTEFYIMEFVEGRIFTDPSIPEVTPEERRKIWHSAITTLAKLHTTPLASTTPSQPYDLTTFGRAHSFYPRQIKTLSAVSQAQSTTRSLDPPYAPVGPIPHLSDLLSYFQQNLPKDKSCIIHGDYKIDNLIFHKSEPRVVGILDWELSTIGHPLSDVVNLTMPWVAAREGMRFAKDDGVSAGQQQEEEDSRRREEEQDAFLEGRTEGLPSREEVWTWYVEGIEKSVRESGNQNGDGISSGFEEGEKEFADGFMLFRTAVISQGIAARFALKQASSAKAADFGRQFPRYAEAAWRIAKRDMEKRRGVGREGEKEKEKEMARL